MPGPGGFSYPPVAEGYFTDCDIVLAAFFSASANLSNSFFALSITFQNLYI